MSLCVWAYLSKKVFDRNPSGVDELKQFCIEEWENIPQSLITELVYSMRRRAYLCLQNNGAKIHY